METQLKPIPAREMHKIVWICLGVFALIAGSYPLAFMRVAQKEKFAGFHVKSLTLEYKPAQQETAAAEVQPAVEPAASNPPAQIDAGAAQMNASAATPPVAAVLPASSTPEITDSAELVALSQTVYDKIDRAWQTVPTFSRNLVYRVIARADGALASFEPVNQPAKEYLQETPLPNLLNSERTGTRAAPVGKFTVVFAPSGVIEVSP
ncbi:hypothetical protein [Kamptonema formosum]|uniref:hypothetical protein n=1 Tax=Kamptonema formosum TaxID=331992 RepID=UPI0004755B9C|nr:hypothetical protein [Oscillatoria sp. PCC 10802]